ncbi:hypothetical protein Tco_1064642 [Tanacetum coccineum]
MAYTSSGSSSSSDSESLNDLLESQVIDKFKTGLGYNAATPAVESFVNSSEMLENQEYNRSKGYHAVPPPYTGNFIPRKPDLTFIDEIVESENMDVTTVITPSNDKTVENKGVSNTVESNAVRMNNSSAPIIDWNSDDESEVVRPVWNNSRRVKNKNFTNKMTHPHPKRSFVPQAVLTKQAKLILLVQMFNTEGEASGVVAAVRKWGVEVMADPD